MKRINIYCKLGDFADKSHIDRFLEKVVGDLTNDPIQNIDTKLMREIYEDSF